MLIYAKQQSVIIIVFSYFVRIWHGLSALFRNQRFLHSNITDIDSFKNINDFYGHNEGDNALLIVSSALKDFCRRNDCFCGRYGGDEFVIIRVMNINESVLPMLDELKNQVYKKCRSRGLEYRIELSFGCSEYSVGCVSGNLCADNCNKHCLMLAATNVCLLFQKSLKRHLKTTIVSDSAAMRLACF